MNQKQLKLIYWNIIYNIMFLIMGLVFSVTMIKACDLNINPKLESEVIKKIQLSGFNKEFAANTAIAFQASYSFIRALRKSFILYIILISLIAIINLLLSFYVFRNNKLLIKSNENERKAS